MPLLYNVNGILIAVLSVSIALLLYGYSIYLSILCLLAIGICSFLLAFNLLDDSKFRSRITEFLIQRFGLKPPETTEFDANQDSQLETKKFNPFVQDFPWNGFTLPRSLNVALEHFANSLIDDYINRWYKSEISSDNTFLIEIKYQIRYATATAIRALRHYDFAALIQEELLPLVVLHVNRICNLMDSADEGTVSLDDEHFKKTFPDDFHVAMHSSDNCEHYLSEIADHLVVRLTDQSRISGREMDSEAPTLLAANQWPSETCRHFLRQLVLSTILFPALEFITDPNTLNLLLITALDPNKSELKDTSNDERVPFLENLSKFGQTDVSDSLLVLKLSDLIRDPRLLQIFDVYLRDIHGPTHWLDCFLQTNDVLRRLQSIVDNEGDEFKEAVHDAWQLYSSFLHKTSKTRIEELFSGQLLESFGKAIEDRSRIELTKYIEEIYMILYYEINYFYVIPFCQSEAYLGYLCGTSADAERLFQDDDQQRARGETESEQSGSLSITQIPSKIWTMLRGDYIDSDDRSKDSQQVDEDSQESFLEEELEDQIEDEMKSIETIDSSFLEVDEFTLDQSQSINMNQWKISIPLVERRRRFRTGKIYFVYIVTIERSDYSSQSYSVSNERKGSGNSPEDSEDEEETQIDEVEAMSQLPKAWSIARTYDEFYAFDRRLRSHFGAHSQRFALLPDRKMICARTKQFLESQRQYMEDFLQRLTSQPTLKHSELFFAFCTNPGESASRRRRETESDDGEYIKPFISRLLAKALTSDDFHTTGVAEEHIKTETNSLDSGAFSLVPDGVSEDARDQSIFLQASPRNPHLFYPKIIIENAEKPDERELQALNKFDTLSGNVSSLSGYLFTLILRPHNYFKVCLMTIIDLFSDTLNRLFRRQLKDTVDTVLDENTVLYIVKALHEVVFDEHRTEMSEEETRQRTQTAERFLKQWLMPSFMAQLSETSADRFRQVIQRVFGCFQNTTMNRQLAFVLIDKLTQHILPPNADQILHQLKADLRK